MAKLVKINISKHVISIQVIQVYVFNVLHTDKWLGVING